ncbi:uncharacterized protein LOC134178847 [Corticium candelabrum]|uniref:uncharacterized protein LOC134178847 n=1 Tax=Corticium candelabrum TaxID=121492 RepID=UPI002E25379C|nr:uncharacterized protein LOC134178847 [Corticium candelabrum]
MDPKSFQTMRASGTLCDCTIQIGDEQSEVHGVVMASRSDYFRGLLESGMKDANLVDLSNMPANHDTINLIVDFCYGMRGQDRLDESNIAHVLCSALYLQMSGQNNLTGICRDKLRKLTEQNLTSCLTILDNCTDIGVVAEREGVMEKCVEAAVRHFQSYEEDENGPFDDFCKSVGLENLPIRWMEQILEKMQQSECDLAMITSVSTVYVTSIISCYYEGSQMEGNSPYSLDTNRPSAASPTTLLEAFETIMSYVPDEATTLCSRAVVPTWFARSLEFATKHSLASASRIFSMCASIYQKLAESNDEDTVVYKLKPNIIIELNRVTQANHGHFADCVKKLTDRYLLVQVRHRSLTPSDFVQVLQSTDWCSRESFDAPFVALNEMLEIPEDVMQIDKDEIANMVANIDFTKLSQDELERAAANSKIPREVIMMAAVNVCSTLRSEIAITSQALNDEKIEATILKSASDTANQSIKLLRKQNETLQTQLQIEEDVMEWIKKIVGNWTQSTSMVERTCHYQSLSPPKPDINITATCHSQDRGNHFQLSIQNLSHYPVQVTMPQARFRSTSVSYNSQIDKVYCVRLRGHSEWPFILVNARTNELWTPNSSHSTPFHVWKRIYANKK